MADDEGSTSAMSAAVAPPMFKKKAGIKRDVRSRPVVVDASTSDIPATTSSANHDAADEPASSVVLSKKRKMGSLRGPLRNPLLRSATASRHDRDALSVDEGGDDEDVYGGVSGVIRPRPGDAASTRDDATRTNTWFDDDADGGKADNRERATANNDDGLYRGSAAYSKYVTKHDDGISAKIKGTVKGPVKAGNNVRTITMVDYQPDVCKDYKETGYCGFGDTCKFLHDRSDYLAGWQLDALPNSAARQRGDLDGGGGSEPEDAVEIPFACLICRRAFTDPVVTKCGHYFCSACAIKRFAKTPKCFACGKQTQGIFNAAQKVLDRMQRVQTAKNEERDARRWDRRADDEEVKEQFGGELLDGVEVG